jgi:hypothetical protein
MAITLTRSDQFLDYFGRGTVTAIAIDPALQRLAGQGNVIMTAQIGEGRMGRTIYGEVQYNQATNQVSLPLRANVSMYVCVEIYYKHGEYQTTVISSDEDMRIYCIDQLRGYGDIPQMDVQTYEVAVAQYQAMPLDDLIRLVLSHGRQEIESQSGWGLVDVVKGQNLVEY